MRADVPGPPSWQDAEREGYFDELPDMFVEHWSPSDWDVFLAFVTTGPWRFEFSINGDAAKLPTTYQRVQDVFWHLTLKVGRLEINCHFFGDDDFELTLDPYKVKSEEDYKDMLQFMSDLAKGLGRPVFLCDENNRLRPMFVVAT